MLIDKTLGMRHSLTLSLQSAAAPPGCRGKRPIESVSCHLHPEHSGPSRRFFQQVKVAIPSCLVVFVIHGDLEPQPPSLFHGLCALGLNPWPGCSAREALGVSKDTSWGCGFSSVRRLAQNAIFFLFGLEVLYYWVNERHSLKEPCLPLQRISTWTALLRRVVYCLYTFKWSVSKTRQGPVS